MLTVSPTGNSSEMPAAPMDGLGFLAAVAASSAGGALLGFGAGLVPGLHMNNIAALLTAYGASVFGLFSAADAFAGPDRVAVLVASFVSAALVGHMFSESITSTYVGIPAGDVVSVLPAHRLARAGLGGLAVRTSVDGSLVGVIVGTLCLAPVCLLLGPPVGAYSWLRGSMGAVILMFSALLVVFEGFPSLRAGPDPQGSLCRLLRASIILLSSGVLGTIVLHTDYFACGLPDLPWMDRGFVQKSSLLLPLFAGLFGLPSLILSLGSRTVPVFGARGVKLAGSALGAKEVMLSVIGGAMVGWLPGMTAGSTATLCMPGAKDTEEESDIDSSRRFIWLYSSISACGAVLAVGALFVLMRARSGAMDAAAYFLGDSVSGGAISDSTSPVISMVLAMLLSACLSHSIALYVGPRFERARMVICSKTTTLAIIAFVCSLSVALTGTRGALLMATACCLGLLPPRVGVRRIMLMGCLLVPIAITFLA